ncbi:MAG: TraB/GumN family protein [Spirochaetaceae bacterium]|jgi:pheromone shutdown-related protein TraB|nr:TraB/GumN family protein [Spirochaetaceae bacterium]
MKLNFDDRQIIMVGTAHISEASIREVRENIAAEKPDCVAVELDEQRLESMKNPGAWKTLDIGKVLREKKGLVLLANLMLASFQRRMGSDVGIKPGAEMEAAVNAAEEAAIPVALVDRPIQVTLRRAWAMNSLWGKCKLLGILFSSAFSRETVSAQEIEELKRGNAMDAMMTELAAYLPAVKQVLIDERDFFLASRIWQASVPPGGVPPAAPQRRVLAVLGAGHVPGVAAHLNLFAAGAESLDTAAVEAVPPPSIAGKIAAFVIPVIIAALVAAGFAAGGAGLSGQMLLRWFLWNGSLAAAATVVAGGHILAALTAFVMAPVGTLSPVLSVGIFAGIVQGWVKKPTVEDMERLQEDVGSLRGIYRNRVLRVLLVFLFSSLGGAVGNFIAVPTLVGSLFP